MGNKIFKVLLSLILFIPLIILWSSFQFIDEPRFSVEEMKEINQEVSLRIEAFVNKEKKKCEEELMDLVDSKVDSILMFDAQRLLFGEDTFKIKTKPIKPKFPDLIQPEDDTPLAPLIKDNETIENIIPTSQPK